MLWKRKWNKAEVINLPKTSIFSLRRRDKDLIPNMHTLLKLLIVLPVSFATGETSFFSLRRLKTCLINMTSEIRLNDLDFLSVHRDIYV